MKEITIADMLYCSDCEYTAPDTGKGVYLCCYYLQTGKRRGCPAGDGCKKRKPRKKTKKESAADE